MESLGTAIGVGQVLPLGGVIPAREPGKYKLQERQESEAKGFYG